MVNPFILFLLLIFIIQVCISGFIVLKIYFLYRDLASLQLVTVVLLANVTIISSLVYYNADIIGSSTANLSFKVALFTILLMIISISLLVDKAIYTYKVRLLSKISFFLFCIVLGIISSEFMVKTNNFFYLKDINGHMIPYYSLLPSLLIITGGIAILVGILFSYRDIKAISEGLVAKNGFYLIFISSTTIFAAFIVNLILQTYSSESLVDTFLFNKDFIYLLHFTSLNLLSFSFAYFSYTQPFLNLSGGVRPNLLLDRGLLGYFLAYHTDKGPEPLAYSEQFVKSANISFDSLTALAVSSIVLVGMFNEAEERFISKVSLIPIPNIENYSALIYTFAIKSTHVTDTRFKNKTPTVFAILFPSSLTISVKNMNKTLQQLLAYVIKYETIEDLIEEKNLLSITTAILRKILI